MIIIKRLIGFICILLLLTGCGTEEVKEKSKEQEKTNETEKQEKEEVSIETIAEREYNILLADNEDMAITLLKIKHELYKNDQAKDVIEIMLEVTNKQSRTFEFFVEELILDGTDIDTTRISMDITEIDSEETEVVKVTAYTDAYLDEFDISLDEHIKGTIWYSDYERSRLIIDFSEYVNE